MTETRLRSINPRLRRQLEVFSARKAALLSQAEGMTQAQLHFRPDPGQWSTLHVLDHLSKVEQSTVATVRRNLRSGHRVSLKDRIGAAMVGLVMRLPIKVKVPAGAKQVVPEAAPVLAEVVLGWQAAEAELVKILKSLTPAQCQAGLMKHPVSGWLDVSGVLSFLSSHLRHHEYQLARIARASKRSASS